MASRGCITGPRVVVPESTLSPGRLFSRTARSFDPDELRHWNQENAGVLDLYGLTIAAGRRLPLRPARRPGGPLETQHRERLVITSALASLAVTAAGRGAALDLPGTPDKGQLRVLKERNDRAATCALAEGIHSLAEDLEDAVCEIAIGEGVRLKPGEKGGNPTLYVGQTFGDHDKTVLAPGQRAARGVRTYWIAVDAVEGTTKSTRAGSSSGSLLYITESEIHRVPDVYFNKCQLAGVGGVDVDDDLAEIIAQISRTRGGTPNVFTLQRPRHPIERMAEMGANVRVDTDGDAFPVIAAGLEWGVFEDNRRPLDGVCGNIGGAAEMIASAAAGHYLGVRSSARFAAKKVSQWDRRYDLGPGEAEAIRQEGFEPGRVYTTEEMVPGVGTQDGVFVASAITDNLHIPFFDGVFWGENFAEVSVLMVGASGQTDLYRLILSFRAGAGEEASLLVPIMESLLGQPSHLLRKSLREALRNPSDARRLRHEFATSFYPHFTEDGHRFRLDMDSVESAETGENLEFLRALTEAAPDWFC